MRWFDHEILRHVWTNQAEIAPGVFRSNQPTFARLEQLQRKGLVSVLCLRAATAAPYACMKAHCDRLGLGLNVIPLSARRAPDRDSLLALIAYFRAAQHPFLMHCKSGADRAGLASAVYLLTAGGQDLASAKRMLSLRYLHQSWSRAGVLDRFLEAYGKDGAGRSFEDWVRGAYDPVRLG
ncbi:fused DSP-PTPase phosphatase/NAD kinase-like protein [Roseicyclus mahoneyensis]|uniref:Tyrosine phosphatase family protein n=1 Tax=Roseicyclus mahoneyensis TaxID=164332 RepID=A0A316GFV8_9RHOB|nr:tyrosine-protein phosphatase [Roseicyclus mahoneyensis]PWK59574.1 tyrosine phosphatase family protein [Roseicyclus mahoneyensis]